MYNVTIKSLNLEQFKLKIKKLDTIKINNILYYYIIKSVCLQIKSRLFLWNDKINVDTKKRVYIFIML